jgi:hypothetical protein
MKLRLSVVLAVATMVFAFAMTNAGASGGGQPRHVVRGQGIVQLNTPNGLIATISINASEDATGVHGVATWLNTYPSGGWLHGWQWVIKVDTITMLAPNKATVGGIIVQDNRFPGNVGQRTSIRAIEDNGQGAADPVDRIFGVPIRGGNFIVR